MRRDTLLVAVLVVSFAGLGWTAFRAFRRAPATRAGADVAMPLSKTAPSRPMPRGPERLVPATDAAPRSALRTDTLPIGDVPEPGAEPPPAKAPSAAPARSYAARNAVPSYSDQPTSSVSSARIDAARSERQTSPTTPAPPKTVAPAKTREKTKGAAAPTTAAPKDEPTKRAPPAAAKNDALESGLGTAAGGLVSQARQLKVAGGRAEALPDFSNPANVRAAFLEQQAVDARVDRGVRLALGRLPPNADIEDQRQATADALAAAGQPHDEISITNALAQAQGSPDARPALPPGALDASINAFASAYQGPTTAEPGPNAVEEEPGPKKPGAPAFVPREKPPRGAREAYRNYASAFAEAAKRFGVQPWDILAVCQQETGFGRNMGRTPLPEGLARRRADMAAAIRLDANGQLPAPWQNLRGSSTGALGPFQFEPATQLWAGRGNPFDWGAQISYSVPHLLILNGYKPNDLAAQRKAYGRYYGDGNPNGKYATSVAGHAAAIRPVIEAEKP